MSNSPSVWRDKVLLVTGAGPGMGRAVAVLAARAGARVALVARTEATLRETASLVESEGSEALCLAADVTSPSAVKDVVERTVERFGRIDALVHSILPPHFFRRILDMEDSDLESWRHSVEISVYGALLVGREVARVMAEAGGGGMVFVTATSALQGYPAVSAHSVGKAGIHSLVQCMASELGREGIRVNSVAVGVIDGATSKSTPRDLPPQLLADIDRAVDASGGALGRNVTEAEVANAVLFLASEASTGTTGQILAVDGGRFFH